jgi:hypothetical protein
MERRVLHIEPTDVALDEVEATEEGSGGREAGQGRAEDGGY